MKQSTYNNNKRQVLPFWFCKNEILVRFVTDIYLCVISSHYFMLLKKLYMYVTAPVENLHKKYCCQQNLE